MSQREVEPMRYTFAAKDLMHGDSVEIATRAVTLADLLDGPVKNLLVGLGFDEEAVFEAMQDVGEERTRAAAMEEASRG